MVSDPQISWKWLYITLWASFRNPNSPTNFTEEPEQEAQALLEAQGLGGGLRHLLFQGLGHAGEL